MVSCAQRAALTALTSLAALAVTSCAAGQSAVSDPGASQAIVGVGYSGRYLAQGARPSAPPVSGTALTGQRLSLAADRGDIVVMNFWESYCGPCRAEAPALAALARRYAADRVRFLGDDENDSRTAGAAFERTFGITYPSLNDPGGAQALAFHGTVPPSAIPSTVIIDRTGHIAAILAGRISYNGLGAVIKRVLAEKPGTGA